MVDVFTAHPGFFVGTMAMLGLLIGSFLNVIVLRLPVMMEREWRSECHTFLGLDDSKKDPEPFDLIRPRSRCPSCEQVITALDNVPVVSYLMLKGRCRHCNSALSPRYPIIEAVAGLASGYAAWHFGVSMDPLSFALIGKCLSAAAFMWALIALSLIDFDTHYLPDSITMPLLWAGVALSFFGVFGVDLNSSVLGAMLGYFTLWSIYWLFKLITKKEGMGDGDFKLLAALGAWMGWQSLPAIILISSAIGAVVGLTMIATGFIKRSQQIPFGPYLALAGVVVLFCKEPLVGLFAGSASL